MSNNLKIAGYAFVLGLAIVAAEASAQLSLGDSSSADVESSPDPISCAVLVGECPNFRGVRLARGDSDRVRTERVKKPLDQPTANDAARTLLFTSEDALTDADKTTDGNPSKAFLDNLRKAAAAHFSSLARPLASSQCAETKGCSNSNGNTPCKLSESFTVSETDGNGHKYEMTSDGKVILKEKWQLDFKCGCS